MNNSMQGAFDLTDVFAYPLMSKTTENPPYALKKTQHSIIIKAGIGLSSEMKQNIWNLIRNISSQKSQCRSMCWSKMKNT